MKTRHLLATTALALTLPLAAAGSASASHGADDPAGDDHGRHHGHHAQGDDDGAAADGTHRHRGRHHGGRHTGGDDRRTVSARSGGGDDGRVQRSGSCSDGSRWKIKAKPDDGRLEVEAEIDSGTSGERWTWVLRRNDSVSAKGASRTAGRSGSFEVERRSVDGPGTDAFVFRATHGGETCVASVSI